MAGNDDLTLEITGSSEKAESALDRVIAKISKLQEAFEKMSPSLTDFTKKMDSMASSSKAFAALEKLTKGTGDLSAASKKAEANEAMYQARLDRANVSMERSRVQSEKLAAAQRKLAEAEAISAHNQAAFSMTNPDEFEKKFKHSGTESVTAAPAVESAQMSIPTMKYDSARIQAEMDNLSARIGGKKIKVNLDTDAATAEVRRMGEYIDSLAPQVSHMSAESQEKFNSVAHSLEFVSSQIDNQRMLLRNLRSEYAGVAQETGEGSTKSLQFEKRILSSSSAIDRLISKQEKLKAELSQVGAVSDEAGAESERSGKRASSGWSRFQTMMSNMFLRIAMFRLFSLVSQGVVTGIQNMALASSQANGTMSALATDSLYLKNSLAAALMPALQALVPALNQVTEAVANVFNTIGMLTARIFNHASTVQIAKRSYVDYAKTINQSGNDASQVAQKEADAAAKASAKAADAQEKAEKRQTAAEERVQKAIQEHQAKIDALKKSILGFDEINALSEKNDTWTPPTVPDYTSDLPTAASYNTAAAPQWNGMQSPATMFETVKVPAWVEKVGEVVDGIKKSLADITAVVSGALLAVGAILLLTGANIPLGLGLMAVGAIGLAMDIKANWGSMTTPLLNTLTTITAAVGGFLLALGAIMAFSGANIPLGIGLMAAGAVSLGTAVGINWGNMKTNVSTVLSGITGLLSGALLAVGAMLAFTGVNVPLGIGLMSVGAVGLAATVTLNWSSMSAKTKETVSTITSIVSAAMLAVGGILTFSGAAPILGIAMMAVGAATLATTVAVNWSSMSIQLKSTLSTITAAVGGFLLALGAVFVFSGASLPLGIGLMVAGAASLATSVTLNWKSMSGNISSTAREITRIVSGVLLALGAVLAFSGGNIPLGIGLMAAGAVGLVATSGLNWNRVMLSILT